MVYLIYLMKRAKDIDEQKEKGRPPYITRLRDIYRVPRKKVVHLLKSPNKTVVLGVLFGVFPGRTFFRGTLYTVYVCVAFITIWVNRYPPWIYMWVFLFIFSLTYSIKYSYSVFVS